MLSLRALFAAGRNGSYQSPAVLEFGRGVVRNPLGRYECVLCGFARRSLTKRTAQRVDEVHRGLRATVQDQDETDCESLTIRRIQLLRDKVKPVAEILVVRA